MLSFVCISLVYYLISSLVFCRCGAPHLAAPASNLTHPYHENLMSIFSVCCNSCFPNSGSEFYSRFLLRICISLLMSHPPIVGKIAASKLYRGDLVHFRHKLLHVVLKQLCRYFVKLWQFPHHSVDIFQFVLAFRPVLGIVLVESMF